MLAEMDEEFGIAELISDVVKEDKQKVRGSCDWHVISCQSWVLVGMLR